jgi:hypothetical protein
MVGSGESAETEQGVECDMVSNGDRGPAQRSATRIEWLCHQVAVAPIDQVSIGIGRVAADAQECVILLTVHRCKVHLGAIVTCTVQWCW